VLIGDKCSEGISVINRPCSGKRGADLLFCSKGLLTTLIQCVVMSSASRASGKMSLMQEIGS